MIHTTFLTNQIDAIRCGLAERKELLIMRKDVLQKAINNQRTLRLSRRKKYKKKYGITVFRFRRSMNELQSISHFIFGNLHEKATTKI